MCTAVHATMDIGPLDTGDVRRLAGGWMRSRTDRNPQYIPDPRRGRSTCVHGSTARHLRGRPTSAANSRLSANRANVRTSTPIHAECERSLVHDSVFSGNVHARIWNRVSQPFRWKLHSGTVHYLDIVRSPYLQNMYLSLPATVLCGPFALVVSGLAARGR